MTTDTLDEDAGTPLSVTDEELFEAYLTARLQQALEGLNGAREQLAAQPDDFNRALAVLRKVHELREARLALTSQRARVAAARRAAGLPGDAPEPEPVVQATPSAAFRSAQAEQAERIMARLATRPRTCPSCQALLDADAPRCQCAGIATAEPVHTPHPLGWTPEPGSRSS